MVELELNIYSLWVKDAYQFEVVKWHWLKIQIAPCIVDACLVALLKEVFPFHLDFFSRVIDEYPGVLAPLHQECIVFYAAFSEYLVALQFEILLNFNLPDHLARGRVPSRQILILV